MELQSDNLFIWSFVNMLSEFKSIQFKDALVKFHFSIYKNGIPGSGKTPDRIILDIQELSYDSLINIQDSLKEGYELAINSLITINERNFHIPFVDFSSEDENAQFLRSTSDLIKKCKSDLYLLKSGHSFHGYFDLLLSEENWISYLGNLLLMNKPNANIVDSRWIGHSLQQGYSALRISFKTKAYKQFPEFYKKIEFNPQDIRNLS